MIPPHIDGLLPLSLWWPSATTRGDQELARERHENNGVAAFYDGHVGIFKDPDPSINPIPGNPEHNINYWAPQ